MSRRARAQRHGGALWLVVAAVGVFLFAPIVVVALYSFNSSRSLSHIEGLSTRWYSTLFSNGDIWSSVAASAKVAAITTVVAVVLGTMLALALSRGGRAARLPGTGLVFASLMTPEVVLAFGLLLLFTTLNVNFSMWTVVLGHVTFAVAYVALIVRARLVLLSPAVEEAARDLGAGRLGAVGLVVLPQLAPAIGSSALLVFVLSFDDFVVSLFTSGPGFSPLPVRIYSMIRFGISPEINAVGTLMMVFTVTLGVIAAFLTRRALTAREV
jgi:spermidine/putrescine transport system permease protein